MEGYGRVLTRTEWFESRDAFTEAERFIYFKLISATDARRRINQRLIKQTELFQKLLSDVQEEQKQEHKTNNSEVDESKIKVKTKEYSNK